METEKSFSFFTMLKLHKHRNYSIEKIYQHLKQQFGSTYSSLSLFAGTFFIEQSKDCSYYFFSLKILPFHPDKIFQSFF